MRPARELAPGGAWCSWSQSRHILFPVAIRDAAALVLLVAGLAMLGADWHIRSYFRNPQGDRWATPAVVGARADLAQLP